MKKKPEIIVVLQDGGVMDVISDIKGVRVIVRDFDDDPEEVLHVEDL